MRTILVSGSDTGIGKTWVVAQLARSLAVSENSVQVVKPVETGVAAGESGDAAWVAEQAGLGIDSLYTLFSFREAIAPVAAARAEERTLSFGAIVSEIQGLPECDWRIVEGAGGIAVPLSESGEDWASLASELKADAVVLVVDWRLGAINQARMCHAYAQSRGLQCGVWLNASSELDARVAESTLEGVRESGVPLWGLSEYNQQAPALVQIPWLAKEMRWEG